MRALLPLSFLLHTSSITLSGCAGIEAGEGEAMPGAPGKSDSLGAGDPWLTDAEWEEIRERCAPDPDAPPLRFSDYRWGLSFEEMEELYWELYSSGKRLPERAYHDEKRDLLVLPITSSWGGEVILAPRLVKSVRAHIEKALERNYVDFVFFPDMGHSHFFIPRDHWEARYAGRPVSAFGQMYTELFDDPELKVLYHTAEQLEVMDEDRRLLPDRHLQWRFYTRNPVGDNRGAGALELHHDPTHSHNTVRDYEGHRYHGGGFYLSAGDSGCFPFTHQGVTHYFDLTMQSLP
jgi:hypothetical protein